MAYDSNGNVIGIEEATPIEHDSNGNDTSVAEATPVEYDSNGNDVLLQYVTPKVYDSNGNVVPDEEPVAGVPIVTIEAQTVFEEDGVLEVVPGTWTGTDPIVFTYQWLRCDADGTNANDITGEVDITYTLVNDDVTHSIRVRETATNDAGSANETSDATQEIA